MVIDLNLANNNLHLLDKAKKIKLVITDSDGVLTDTGVYYNENGEALKRFSIRDGMGVERLRELKNIETGIITGENSGPVTSRAIKLKITEIHPGVKDKVVVLNDILKRKNLLPENVAYIGDDVNDLGIIEITGLTASPSDALSYIKDKVDYICLNRSGNGAFREFAELIIALQSI